MSRSTNIASSGELATVSLPSAFSGSSDQARCCRRHLRIAYVIQNVGIDFDQETGDIVPVNYTLRGLQRNGHEISCLKLRGLAVTAFSDVSNWSHDEHELALGLTGAKAYQLLERAVRRVQREFQLPYFAMLDSFRFYEACLNHLASYDLCHEHNGLLSAGAALACWRMKVPYVLTFSADPIMESEVVGKPLKGNRLRAAVWIARLTYQVADRIICVSSAAKRHLMNTWNVAPSKIIVVPNGVDTELFCPQAGSSSLRRTLGLQDNLLIGFSGSFQLWHGLDRLIESFSYVLNQLPNARLLLLGDGPARPLLEKKISSLGIAKSVIFPGIVPHNLVPEYLSLFDVAVLPYPQLPEELWFSPLKLYEYMAAGKAVVASRSGQIAEVLDDGRTGVLVEAGEIKELSQALISLLKNPVRRNTIGENARKKALVDHSWDRYITRLESVYGSVLGKTFQDH